MPVLVAPSMAASHQHAINLLILRAVMLMIEKKCVAGGGQELVLPSSMPLRNDEVNISPLSPGEKGSESELALLQAKALLVSGESVAVAPSLLVVASEMIWAKGSCAWRSTGWSGYRQVEVVLSDVLFHHEQARDIGNHQSSNAAGSSPSMLGIARRSRKMEGEDGSGSMKRNSSGLAVPAIVRINLCSNLFSFGLIRIRARVESLLGAGSSADACGIRMEPECIVRAHGGTTRCGAACSDLEHVARRSSSH
jgi:hypothetical protein